MLPYFSGIYGNASSSHSFGRKAENAIETARETVARTLNCKASEIIFTSGGSEADNAAVRGAALAQQNNYRRNHLITTPIEHEAVIKTIQQLSTIQNFSYTLISTNPRGLYSQDTLTQAIQSDTALVSIIYANNEVGTIQPISQLATTTKSKSAIFHTDAVQAAGQLTLDVQELNVDLLSISAHKFYGPKGVGALYIRDGLEITPYQTGGSHEAGQRAGTHNTPCIVGLARALEIAYEELDTHIAHYQKLRDQLIDGVLSSIQDAQLTGHPTQRLPSHASFIIPGIDSSSLLMHLDVNGIAASGGSACKTGNPEPSEVLLALGYSEYEAIGGLRFTVGRQNTEEEIDYTVKTLAQAVQKLRKIRTTHP
jgi:cysteine desulfurase